MYIISKAFIYLQNSSLLPLQAMHVFTLQNNIVAKVTYIRVE